MRPDLSNSAVVQLAEAGLTLPDPGRAYVVLVPVLAIAAATLWIIRRVWRDAPVAADPKGRLIVFAIGSLTALLVSVRVPLQPVSAGIDGSYPHVLNILAFSSTVFGRDVIYTYGPLGWLLAAEPVGDHLLLACLFWVTLYACLAALVIACATCFAIGSARIVALVISAGVLWLVDAERLVFALCLLVVVIAYRLPKHRRTMLLIGCALAALAALMKFSAGVSCCSALAGSALFPWAARAAALRLSVLAAGFTASFVALWLSIYGSPIGIAGYVEYSIELSRGYTASMALGQPDETKALAHFAAVIAVVVALAASVRGQRRHAIAVLAGPLFIAWKHGVVRFGDTHLIGFAATTAFCGLAMSLATVMQGAGTRAVATRAIALVLAIVLLDRGMARADFPRPVSVYTPLLSTRTVQHGIGVAGLAESATDWRGYHDRLRATGSANVAGYAWPSAYDAVINGASTGVYATDLSWIAANDFDYRPQPVFQHFNAFTPKLDRWNAAFFRGDARPEFLLLACPRLRGIDGRHVLFDDPVAQLAILDHYAGTTLRGFDWHEAALLRSSEQTRFDSPRILSTRTVPLGARVAVPEVALDGVLRAKFTIEKSLSQRVRESLFRLGPLHVVYGLGDGVEESYRLMPLHCADGVWVEPFFASAASYRAFAARADYDSHRVESIRITADDPADYPASVQLAWELIPDLGPGHRRLRPAVPRARRPQPTPLVGATDAAFPPTSGSISGIAVKLSTYMRVNGGRIELQLLDASAGVLGSASIAAATVRDNHFNLFRFDDVDAVLDRVAVLRLAYRPGPTDSIACWRSPLPGSGFEFEIVPGAN